MIHEYTLLTGVTILPGGDQPLGEVLEPGGPADLPVLAGDPRSDAGGEAPIVVIHGGRLPDAADRLGRPVHEDRDLN